MFETGLMVHVPAEKVLNFDGSRQSRKVKLCSHWKKLHLNFRVIFRKMENISLSKYRRLPQKPNWTNFNILGEPHFFENIILQLMIKDNKINRHLPCFREKNCERQISSWQSELFSTITDREIRVIQGKEFYTLEESI